MEVGEQNETPGQDGGGVNVHREGMTPRKPRSSTHFLNRGVGKRSNGWTFVIVGEFRVRQ